MGPKINKTIDVNAEPVKAKRGRKSKKELMASLNIECLPNKSPSKSSMVNLFVNELTDNKITHNLIDNDDNNDNNNDNNLIMEHNEDDNEENIDDINEENKIVIIAKPGTVISDQKPPAKKRGRKPKGGKIIQQVLSNESHQEDKPNIILHLKCSLKDLQNYTQDNCLVESYNFSGGKNDLAYDLIGNEHSNYNKSTTTIAQLDNEYDCDGNDNSDDDLECKDTTKEIGRKLKQLEHNLHINNVNNKKSACFWDTCEFHNPPVYIPKHFINGTYHVYGCFCSPECGVAYLMNETIDSSTKFERYHLFNHIYTKIYDYKKNIKPAPNPYYTLNKFCGNLSIQEYRSLLRNERLFLIVDKPLTRILPELHEDNDDFILNNKIIPSNNYHVKTKLQRKKQNKTSIVNEKFGVTSQMD
jgi:hypothetical protein